MSTWRPPWSAQGQFAVTLLPPTRASNSVTARRPHGRDRRPRCARARGGPCTPRPAPVGLSPSGHAQPAQPNHRTQHHTRGGPGRRQPTRCDHSDPDRRGMARPSSVCPAWVGEQCKHGCADAQWQTPRRRRRTDGARLRRNPNLRRGRLHHPALPVQPRSVLRDPPRMGPAGGDSAAATPLLSCRDRWSAQLGHLACLRASASKATVVGDAQVGCWVWLLGIVARLVVAGLLGRRPVPQVELRRPQPQQGQAA
jgi:hypothetical protein